MLTLLGVARGAWAGEGEVPTLGNEAALSAGAVVATGRGVGMAWYNPAGLGANRRARIETSSQAFVLRLHRVDGGVATGLPDGERADDIRSREIVIIPGATVWAFRVADHVSLALALFVPSFDEIDMDARSQAASPEVAHGQQIRVQHSQRRYEAGPSVGWEITPEVRIGASAFVVYDRVARSSRAWAWGLDLNSENERFVQTDVSESVRSWGTELVAGVLGAALADRKNVADALAVEKVGPPLHERAAFGHVSGAVVGGPHVVAFNVRQLALYNVRIMAALVCHRREQRPEAVSGGYPLVAHAGQCAVQGVFAQCLAWVVGAWEDQSRMVAQRFNGPQHFNRLARQRHQVFGTHLHALGRDAPPGRFEVDF